MGPPRSRCRLAAVRASLCFLVRLVAFSPTRRSSPQTTPERALRHSHQDVLGEATDERRVVADSRDTESGRAHHAFQVRDIRQRIR